MNRVVKTIKFHEAGLFIPKIGAIGSKLPSESKTFKLKMFATNEGVFINIDDVEAFIPWPTIQCVTLEPLQQAEAKPIVKKIS